VLRGESIVSTSASYWLIACVVDTLFQETVCERIHHLEIFLSQRPKSGTTFVSLMLIDFFMLQELATDLKQELAEKLMDLNVVKFSMYPVKVRLLSRGAIEIITLSLF